MKVVSVAPRSIDRRRTKAASTAWTANHESVLRRTAENWNTSDSGTDIPLKAAFEHLGRGLRT